MFLSTSQPQTHLRTVSLVSEGLWLVLGEGTPFETRGGGAVSGSAQFEGMGLLQKVSKV